MAIPTRGRLDPQGTPLTTIAIGPEGSLEASKDFDAVIDTGFTGFVAMPVKAAESANLGAIGTMPLTDSRGTTQATAVAWASVRLGSERREGFVFLLSEVTETIVGVRFLEEFRKTLTFSAHRKEVFLADDATEN